MLQCIFCLILKLGLSDDIMVQIATPMDIIMGKLISVNDGIVKMYTEENETVYVNLLQIVGVDLQVIYQSETPDMLILKKLLNDIACCCLSPCCSHCVNNSIAELLIQLKEFSQPDQVLLFTLFGIQIMLLAETIELSSDELSIYYSKVIGEGSTLEVISIIVNDAVSDITVLPDENVNLDSLGLFSAI